MIKITLEELEVLVSGVIKKAFRNYENIKYLTVRLQKQQLKIDDLERKVNHIDYIVGELSK